MIARIKRNILTGDEKLTVSLPRRRQLVDCSKHVEPQPQRFGCRLTDGNTEAVVRSETNMAAAKIAAVDFNKNDVKLTSLDQPACGHVRWGKIC